MAAIEQLLMGVFTAIWGQYGGEAVDNPLLSGLRWVYVVVGVLLALDALRRLAMIRGAKGSDSGSRAGGRIVVPWGWSAAFAAEIAVIAVLSVVLSAYDAGAYEIPMIATVVGLHLFPLAWIFKAPGFHFVGALVTAIGVAGLVLVATIAGHRAAVDAGVAFAMGALTSANGLFVCVGERRAALAA